MPTYVCELCTKMFKQKAHFDSHKARKTQCKKMEEPLIKLSKPLTRPFMKWVGGKTQIIEEVLSLFPKTINNYHEPFLGGGSVLLGFLSYGTLKGKVYASDINPFTIALYTHIQTNVDGYILELKKIVDEYNSITGTTVYRKAINLEEGLTSQESYYYYMRNKFNTLNTKTTLEASAILLFLNKTCFRGVYREGPHGFNVPFGHYTTPAIYEEAHLKDVSNLIKDVEFKCQSFEDSLKNIASDDFVYLDPPYAPETDTSFVSYVAEGFSLTHHTNLFKLCKTFQEKNIKFLMSNAEVKLVKEAFSSAEYETKTISCRRAINSKDPAARTNEVLIRNLTSETT